MPLFPPVQRTREGETKWDVPAITAGTPQSRSFARWLVPYRYRTSLRIDNHRGNTALTLMANGYTRRIGAGAVVTVTAAEVGNVGNYTLDADANVAVNVVAVYENGGISHAD